MPRILFQSVIYRLSARDTSLVFELLFRYSGFPPDWRLDVFGPVEGNFEAGLGAAYHSVSVGIAKRRVTAGKIR